MRPKVKVIGNEHTAPELRGRLGTLTRRYGDDVQGNLVHYDIPTQIEGYGKKLYRFGWFADNEIEIIPE